VGIRADVTDGASVDRMVREVERSLGPVRILVNCAGTCGAIGPLWEIEPDDWRRDVDASLLGTFLCARAVLPAMVARRSGRVINVSSYAAIRATPYRGRSYVDGFSADSRRDPSPGKHRCSPGARLLRRLCVGWYARASRRHHRRLDRVEGGMTGRLGLVLSQSRMSC
jgi:NAD(P)-dependent dehydrogenase (short-subunit alcohol dehydrogenase family)